MTTEGNGGATFRPYAQSYRGDANLASAFAPERAYVNRGAQVAGTTGWEQYRQVFDAIVFSNAWNDATAALQLLSHLEGDATNVALLIPAFGRASRRELVNALLEHYGSPGRLADSRRQFEIISWVVGADPSIFAIELEMLALKAFKDLGQMACLHLVRDRFMAEQDSCDLHRHLDSVPPETAIRDTGLLIGAGYGRVTLT